MKSTVVEPGILESRRRTSAVEDARPAFNGSVLETLDVRNVKPRRIVFRRGLGSGYLPWRAVAASHRMISTLCDSTLHTALRSREAGRNRRMPHIAPKIIRGCRGGRTQPENIGRRGRTRTGDPLLRRQMLYPPELRARRIASLDFKPLPEFANLPRRPIGPKSTRPWQNRDKTHQLGFSVSKPGTRWPSGSASATPPFSSASFIWEYFLNIFASPWRNNCVTQGELHR